MADAAQIINGALNMGLGAAFNSFDMNQTTDQIEFIVQAPESSTITKLGFRQATLSGVSPTFKISIQGVSAGVPDGTIVGGASPASATFTVSSGNNSKFVWITLDNAYTVARGDVFSIVIAYSSGTIDASNHCTFGVTYSAAVSQNLPYCIQNDAGARTKQSAIPVYGFSSNSKAYGNPIQSTASQAFNSGSSPNEYGFKFTLPAAWSSSFQVVGVKFGLTPTTGHNMLIQLYQGGNAADTTVLQNVTYALDNSTGASRFAYIYFDEATLSTLSFGSSYRLSFAPQDATNQTLFTASVATASDWDAIPGGQNYMLTSRAGGNWTDMNTSRMLAELLFADISAQDRVLVFRPRRFFCYTSPPPRAHRPVFVQSTIINTTNVIARVRRPVIAAPILRKTQRALIVTAGGATANIIISRPRKVM